MSQTLRILITVIWLLTSVVAFGFLIQVSGWYYILLSLIALISAITSACILKQELKYI